MGLTVNKRSLLNHTNLFLVFWVLIGVSISQYDIDAYTLQHAGADAWVSYGSPHLGQSSIPAFKPRGDVFRYEGKLYPAKQPGQFALSALAYALVKATGLSYESDYRLTAALVTFFSASLMSAIALIVIYTGLKNQFNCHWKPALLAVISLGVGSQWLPYSGIAHHDIMASCCLVIALFVGKLGAPLGTAFPSRWRLMLAAFLLGLSFFISMLPTFVAGTLGLVYLLRWKLRGLPFLAAGFLLGITPLLLYNYASFGNPLLQANVAGNYNDTFLILNIKNFLHHFNAYFGFFGMSQWLYAPLLMLGAMCIWQLPRQYVFLKCCAGFGFGLHVLYITNIETLGTCSYGPRYLIPILPFASIGLALYLNSLRNSARRNDPSIVFLTTLFITLLVLGVLSAIVGALFGTMNCNLSKVQMLYHLNGRRAISVGHLTLLNHYWTYVLPPLALITGLNLVLSNRSYLIKLFSDKINSAIK